MTTAGVYEIRNKINGKRYIGSAINLRKRWRDHRNLLRRNKHTNPHIQNSWNKHGKENFEFRVLFLCAQQDVVETEQCFLNVRKPEYNISPTAGSTLGCKLPPFSPGHKRKISEAKMGNTCGLGHRRTEEFKRNLKARMMGNTYGLGYKHDIRKRRGDLSPHSKLKAIQIPIIRELCQKGISKTEIARRYGVSHRCIHDVITRRTRKHIKQEER